MATLHPRFASTLVPLEGTRHRYDRTSISAAEGEFLRRMIVDGGYARGLEVGCALGVASLYLADGLRQASGPSLLAVDPYQTRQWERIGVRNVEAYGASFFTLLEAPSELALPRLLADGRRVDLVFVDGWHTFDHTLLDLFYANRLLEVGGTIVVDDSHWPAVARAVRYVASYPAYELVLPGPDEGVEVRDGAPYPTMVALRKVAEDRRRFDWVPDDLAAAS